MFLHRENQSIVALATPLGQAPLAIIRASGKNIFPEVQSIFRAGKKIQESHGHEIIFGYIFDPQTGKDIDQVLVNVFKAPRSFTGENMIEITCHGGLILFQKILDLLVKQGCLLAQKGEFSYRAFLNNKMDLTQAEAIHDLIFSRSERVSQMVLGSLKKRFYENTQHIKKRLLTSIAKIEAGIDYPEEDIDSWGHEDFEYLKDTMQEIRGIVEISKRQQGVQKGYSVAIVGEPNAGKSSLLNLLAGEDKAIVSNIAGTTRDPIEVFLVLGNLPITFIDTAGIREQASNEIEAQGIQKTQHIMLTADLILFLIDSTEYSMDTVQKEIQKLKQEKIPFFVVWNKKDLLGTLPLLENIPSQDQYFLSCKNQEGLSHITEMLQQALSYHILPEDSLFFVNQRQSHLLEQVLVSLEEIPDSEETELELEILSLLLQKSLSLIGELDGSDIKDDILEQIFSQFCVGK